MRLWLAVVFLFGCRSELIDPEDLSPTHDAAAVVLDQSSKVSDLSSADGLVCSPANPTGFCAPGTTCCPFSCWGGSDASGWCAPSIGCPIC